MKNANNQDKWKDEKEDSDDNQRQTKAIKLEQNDIINKKKPRDVFVTNNKTILTRYFCKELWQRLKFVNDDMLANNDSIMNNTYMRIDKKREEWGHLFTPIARLMKSVLNSKRGYTTEHVQIHLQGKVILKT